MKMAARRTKVDDVLQYLQANTKGITPAEARDLFHSDRLADIIYKLKKRGYEIETIMEEGRDAYGKNTYARYVLKKDAA